MHYSEKSNLYYTGKGREGGAVKSVKPGARNVASPPLQVILQAGCPFRRCHSTVHCVVKYAKGFESWW